MAQQPLAQHTEHHHKLPGLALDLCIVVEEPIFPSGPNLSSGPNTPLSITTSMPALEHKSLERAAHLAQTALPGHGPPFPGHGTEPIASNKNAKTLSLAVFSRASTCMSAALSSLQAGTNAKNLDRQDLPTPAQSVRLPGSLAALEVLANPRGHVRALCLNSLQIQTHYRGVKTKG